MAKLNQKLQGGTGETGQEGGDAQKARQDYTWQ